MIGQYCGAKSLKVSSSGDYVFLRHVTGDSPVGKGFQIQNTIFGCWSGTIEPNPGETLYITSPNSPFMYPNNIECSWRLYLLRENSYIIVLQVLESDLENSTGCHKDYMEVYDGYHRMPSNLLGRWCERETPTYVALLGNMMLNFRSDGSGVGTGFNISYTAVDKPDWPTLPKSVESGEIKYITSLKKSTRYPDNLNISWALTVQDSENYTIMVQVLMSDIENSTCCHKDWMEAYDVTSGENQTGSSRYVGVVTGVVGALFLTAIIA